MSPPHLAEIQEVKELRRSLAGISSLPIDHDEEPSPNVAGDLIADIVYSSGGVDLSKLPVNEVRVSSTSDEDTWTTTSDSIDIEAIAKPAPEVSAKEEKDEKKELEKEEVGIQILDEETDGSGILESGDLHQWWKLLLLARATRKCPSPQS